MKIIYKITLFLFLLVGSVTFYSKITNVAFAQTPTPAAPSVTTNTTTNQTQYITYSVATLNGQIDSIGSASVTRRGFRYGLSGTYTDYVCTDGTYGTGTYSLTTGGTCNGVTASTLQCNKTYDVQAYAINSAGITYGLKRSFNSGLCPTVPVISNSVSSSSVTTSSAVLTATISSTGGASYPVTLRGFEYGTSALYGQTVYESGSFGAGSYSLTVTGLTCGTVYHFHPYASNGVGTNTTVSDKTFTTNPCPSPTPTPASPPSVDAPTASSITGTSATLNSNISSLNHGTVTTRGFNYGTTVSYGNDIWQNSGPYSTGAFTGSASSLTCGTTYHFRAFAKNEAGTTTTSDQTFSTSACPSATPTPTPSINTPTLNNLSASSISVSSATISADIISTGGENISERGFNYGLTNTWGINVNQTAGNYGTGTFSTNLTGLTCATTYHYRAYGTNSAGTTYTADDTFTTGSCPTSTPTPTPTPVPGITTGSATNITASSATMSGNLTSTGGDTVTRRGIEYGETNFTDIVCQDGNFSTGAFSLSAGGTCGAQTSSTLSCGKTYKFRAFATNSGGKNSGATSTFDTPVCINTPTVSGTSATSIGSSTAVINANIDSNGGSAITARGFNYGLTSNWGTNINQTSGPYAVGSFSASLSNLSCATTYHYRAYAENAIGRTDTTDATFTTGSCPVATPTPTPTPPVVSVTASSSNVTRSGAKLNGIITSGSATERGFEYGLTQLYGTVTKQNGSYGTGSFSLNVTGLAPGLTYHFRSYAKNDGGSSSSTDATFSTNPTPGNLSGWAYSSNIGWINLNSVAVNQTTGDLTGYGWSSNIGWVKFGGLSNFPDSWSGGSSTGNANLDLDTGEVKGWARACAGTSAGDCSAMTSRTDGWDGWIELAGTNHVSLSMGDKKSLFDPFLAKADTFMGGLRMNLPTGIVSGMAWGSNVVGWLSVNASTSTNSFSASCSGADLKNGKVRFSVAAKGGGNVYEYNWNNSGIWGSSPTFDIDYTINSGTVSVPVQVRENGKVEILTPSCSYTPSNVQITWDKANPCAVAPTVALVGNQVTASVSGNLVPASTYAYTWIWGDTTTTSAGNSKSDTTHTYTQPGTYDIILSYTDVGQNSSNKGQSGQTICQNQLKVNVKGIDLRIGANASDIQSKNDQQNSVYVTRKGKPFRFEWENTLDAFDADTMPDGYRCQNGLDNTTDTWSAQWLGNSALSGAIDSTANIPGSYKFSIKCNSDTYGEKFDSVLLKVFESDAKEI